MATQENCCNSRATFWTLFAISQVLGVFVIALYVIWQIWFKNGFEWDHYTNKQFAIHPLVMILSMVVLYGQGALLFRVIDCIGRKQVKIIHMIIMGCALALAAFGVGTIFVYHAHQHYGNMYTMHSWCGMVTVGAFGAQFFFGFGILLFSGVDSKLRQSYLKIHRYGSFAILTMTAASVISGVVDDIFLCMSNKSYRKLKPHALIFNIMGIVSLVIILDLMYLLYRNDWKRAVRRIPESDIIESGDLPLPPPPPTAPVPETMMEQSETKPLLASK